MKAKALYGRMFLAVFKDSNFHLKDWFISNISKEDNEEIFAFEVYYFALSKNFQVSYMAVK